MRQRAELPKIPGRSSPCRRAHSSASGYPASAWRITPVAEKVRARGVPFVVVIFPLFANPLDDAYPFRDLHAKVAQAAGESGAKVVDLLPHYRTVDWKLLVIDGAADEHPNEIAHRIAAQAIVKAVDEVVPRAAAASAARPAASAPPTTAPVRP